MSPQISARWTNVRWTRKARCLLPALGLLIWSGESQAQSDSDRRRATGEWGSTRTALEDDGISFPLKYTGDVLGNPVGGESQGLSYAAKLKGGVELDLEKLLAWQDTRFVASASWNQGRDLSADHIGNIFPASQIFAGTGVRLLDLYLEHKFWQERLAASIGRLSVGATFATSSLYDYYVSDAINSNPDSLKKNLPSFTSSSYAQWGVQAVAEPGSAFYLSLGAFNADPRVKDDASHGVDFTLNPQDGVLSLAEIGFRPEAGTGNGNLPGRYALGGYYDSSDYDRLDDPTRQQSGNYGFYALAEQMVYQEPVGAPDQGLSVWASVTIAPDQEINRLPFAAYGGLLYKGLISGRDQDVSALGLFYAQVSEDLLDPGQELVIEANHRLQLAPWIYFTPDVQYILNPGGTGDVPDALVLGFEFSVTF